MTVDMYFKDTQFTVNSHQYDLRIPEVEDATSLYKNVTYDLDVAYFLSWEPHSSVIDTEEFLAQTNSKPDIDQTWVIEEVDSKEVIGLLSCRPNEDGTIAEIGYCLSKSWWGKGLMKGAIEALIAELEDKSKVTKIWACPDPENTRSVKVLEKIGMTYEKDEINHMNRPNISSEAWKSVIYSIELQVIPNGEKFARQNPRQKPSSVQ